MTKQEAIIFMGYTGITTVNFGDFHEDVEERLGRPVYTHEFADKDFSNRIKELYKEDFIKMCKDIKE